MNLKSKEELAFIVLRVMVAIIIATHGWHRFLSGGYEPFGGWLSSQGFPFGLAIAWGITLFEIVGSPLLALGKKLPYLCATYIVIYLTGVFMVHLPNGWFVVGSGTNGVEYSLLLIVSLFCIGYPQYKKSNNSISS